MPVPFDIHPPQGATHMPPAGAVRAAAVADVPARALAAVPGAPALELEGLAWRGFADFELGDGALRVQREGLGPWPPDRASRGACGEELAAELAEATGCVVLDRNWRCRHGELDLVVRAPGGTVRAIEVRTRTPQVGRGTPLETITRAKAHRLRRLTGLWLSAYGPQSVGAVIDVVGVEPCAPGAATISWFWDVV